MSFFLSENSEKRHLFTLATLFPISGVPSKNRKSNPKSNPKLIKVVTLTVTVIVTLNSKLPPVRA